MTIREALEEVIASIEVRFPVIEYAIDKKPYLEIGADALRGGGRF